MWLITTVGFFSVVQRHPDDDFLTVRARVAEDLDHLRATYLPELTETTTCTTCDYKYRATVRHSDFARACAKLVENIHYDNFKSEVGRTHGWERESIYHEVWHDLHRLQH